MVHLLVHAQGWARILELRSGLPRRCQGPATWVVFYCLPRHMNGERGWQLAHELTLQKGCRNCTPQLNCYTTTPAHRRSQNTTWLECNQLFPKNWVISFVFEKPISFVHFVYKTSHITFRISSFWSGQDKMWWCFWKHLKNDILVIYFVYYTQKV